MTRLFNLFASPHLSEYAVHMWTIPAELRASIVLTLVLLMFSRCTTYICLIFMTLVAGYSLTCGMWEIMLNIMGTCFAELDAIRPSCAVTENYNSSLISSSRLGASTSDPALHLRKFIQDARTAAKFTWRRIDLTIVLVASLFLLSAPSDRTSDTSGCRFISTLVPGSLASVPMRVVNGTSAIMLIYALPHSRTLQKPFNSAIAQYLGSISFSLYIVHGLVLHVVSYAIVPALWRMYGSDTAFR